MPPFEVHCADCIRELGEPFEEVHQWLDELFSMVGSDHRDVRHNEKGVEKVRKMFGDRAAQAAEIHIMKDEHGIVPKIDNTFMMRMAFKPEIYEAFRLEYNE